MWVLAELAGAAESMISEMKRLVFAAHRQPISGAQPLRASIANGLLTEPNAGVWRAGPTHTNAERYDIGALLDHAEKYRCNDCGFPGAAFYWHCRPSFGDSFEETPCKPPLASCRFVRAARLDKIRYDSLCHRALVKTVVSVAGRGTRFLPVTRTTEGEPEGNAAGREQPASFSMRSTRRLRRCHTLFITGSSKRPSRIISIQTPNSEGRLQGAGETGIVDTCVGFAGLGILCVYIAQRRRWVEVHAVLCARRSSARSPYGALADDLIDAAGPAASKWSRCLRTTRAAFFGVPKRAAAGPRQVRIVNMEAKSRRASARCDIVGKRPKTENAAPRSQSSAAATVTAAVWRDL